MQMMHFPGVQLPRLAHYLQEQTSGTFSTPQHGCQRISQNARVCKRISRFQTGDYARLNR